MLVDKSEILHLRHKLMSLNFTTVLNNCTIFRSFINALYLINLVIIISILFSEFQLSEGESKILGDT